MLKAIPVPACVLTLVFCDAAMAEIAWNDKVELSSLVEVEAFYNHPDEGYSTSDVVVATIELGLAAQIDERLSAKVAVLYEEDETDLEIDIATISYSSFNDQLIFTAGQFYLPFGVFETNLISDPLTYEVGETRESGLLLTYESGAFSSSLFLFNGSNRQNNGRDDEVDNFGLNVAYSHKSENINLSAAYINDLGDSDLIQSSLSTNDIDSHVAGATASAILQYNRFNLFLEYVTALDRFEYTELFFSGRGAQPSAYTIETGWNFNISNKDSVLAMAYQFSEEALSLGLPKSRAMLGLALDLTSKSTLAFELTHDEDYAISNGGNGISANSFTLQWAVEW